MCDPRKENGREEQLYSAVRTILEQSGEIAKFKALIQSKVLDVVRGGENIPQVSAAKRDPKVVLLNRLIMEYFHWFGYQYTAEMFATESGSDASCPLRSQLEGLIGVRKPHIPILLDVVIQMCENKAKI